MDESDTYTSVGSSELVHDRSPEVRSKLTTNCFAITAIIGSASPHFTAIKFYMLLKTKKKVMKIVLMIHYRTF